MKSLIFFLLPFAGFSQVNESRGLIDSSVSPLYERTIDTIGVLQVCEEGSLEVNAECLFEGNLWNEDFTEPLPCYLPIKLGHTENIHKWVYKNPLNKTGYKLDLNWIACPDIVQEDYERICSVCLRWERKRVVQHYVQVPVGASKFERLKAKIKN